MISRYCRQRSLIGGVLRSRARFHATSCSDEDIRVLAPTPRLQCILDAHADTIVSCTVCGERIRGAMCVAYNGEEAHYGCFVAETLSRAEYAASEAERRHC